MPTHADQQSAIAFLSAPASYGSDVVTVERIDTHCSIVFLAGDRAYKLKRAVKFSYLDYSTPDLRRKACAAEVTLNRRTAPKIYLGVLPILRRPDGRGLEFGRADKATDAEPIDWVVEMRRFDQDILFDRLCDRGALTPELMQDLGDAIAAFHASAEADPSYGGRSGMEWVLSSNNQNLGSAKPGTFPDGQVAELERLSSAALDCTGALLEQRRATGRVRLCHGDLHLRNICLMDGRPTLFDGIEFSRSVACIDVLYDLAFLVMDLEQRGRRDLANAVFNRYLDRSDESGGLPALPLFLSARAAIRAHTGMAAADRQQSIERQETLRHEARHFLEIALAFLRPVTPRLIAIGGLSGSGKTTLARALAPHVGRAPGARVVRSDVVRKRLFNVAPEDALDASAYTAAVNERVYDDVRTEAATVLTGGQSVIADAVFARPNERQSIETVARTAGVPFLGLWLEAPADVLVQRVDGRRRDASDATAAVVKQQLDYDAGTINWRRIDTAPGIAASLATVESLLSEVPLSDKKGTG